ncbi:class I SAM-dependent methyltransferase [Leminorella grimontii]|uniref:class I SAM-dependent methyltransferase n=1 Tax=Leminorella grimontii TaxID=82981 RepID=UPI00321FA034
MKENIYDSERFFEKYRRFPRSVQGLAAAGEWHELEKMLPDFAGKRVLDLGCGFGWHCIYAAERGAASVLGTDISANMLSVAREKTSFSNVEYRQIAIEDVNLTAHSVDVVISSLALHYVEDFESVCQRVYEGLAPGGTFVFSVEHPAFTAYGTQDWYFDKEGNRLHWPVDRYFTQGWRKAVFLGEEVPKHHKTLTTYINGLLKSGFRLTSLVEPQPAPHLLEAVPEMADELRRPMMLLAAAVKP